MRHVVIPVMLTVQLIAGGVETAEAQQEFSIFCSSNMDGTGKCRKVDGDEVLNCLIIPGGVVACRDIDKQMYECVQYGAITANQTQFACVVDVDNSVNDQLFERDDFEVPSKPKTNPSTELDASQAAPTTPHKAQEKQTSSESKQQPVIQNPFQTSPAPEINENEFQSVF